MRHLHLLAALALTVGCGASSAAEPAPERAPGGAAASCGAASAYEGGRMLAPPDGAQVFVRELGDLEIDMGLRPEKLSLTDYVKISDAISESI